MSVGATYIFDGCKYVGEKHLISVDSSATTSASAQIKILGKGVKQYVIYYKDNSTSGSTVLCAEIDSNGSKVINYSKGKSFVFIVGVPN